MSVGLPSDIVIKLLPGQQGYTLSFHRRIGGPSFDVPLRRWEERVGNLRKNLSLLLDPLRAHIGVVDLTLKDSEIQRAFGYLERLGYGMLALLLEGSGRTASDTMTELTAFLAPVFLSKPLPARPVVEVEASSTDDLAWRMPFEFLPIAPPLTPRIAAREDFERFFGFRAEIVRSLRAGSVEIRRDAQGRVPIHLFAYAGRPLQGMRNQADYLRANTTIVTEWPANYSVPDSFEGVNQLAEQLHSLPPPAPDGAIRGIAHFSCHYVAGGPNKEGGYHANPTLYFGGLGSTEIEVDIFQLRGAFEAKQTPRDATPLAALFFMNTCESGAGGNYDNTMLGFLQDRNATAILGSETLLPDRLAGEFAIEFYRGMLRGIPVGEAVVNARRRLLERFGNPVGLFYTFYGNPMLRVPQAHH